MVGRWSAMVGGKIIVESVELSAQASGKKSQTPSLGVGMESVKSHIVG